MQDLNEIAIFARVVREQSFTKAARVLGLPKSTVSERVSRLEERLGVRLLERTTRHVRPTAAGAAYYERAARVVAEIEEANAAVTDIHRSPKGLLRVASPLLFGHAFLGDFVAEFLVKHPEIEVELIVADRRFDVVEEGLDLAIHVLGPIEASLIARKIGAADRLCVASPNYLAAHEPPRVPKDLHKHSCLVSSNDRRATWIFTKDGRSESIAVQGRYSVNSVQLTLTSALRGAGIAVLPAFFCVEALRAGLLTQVLEGWSLGRSDIHVVYPGSRHLSARVRLFVDALIDRFTALPPWLLGKDGRAFVIDETRLLEGQSDLPFDGRPVYGSIRALAPHEPSELDAADETEAELEDA
ncbi:MAG TPA: LysR family transcriptional regulator [Polyangiaceae bacterium]|jgi:DNA-binding transcriptional LysR family regulator|nr:LysR family transcriptional regulator [Polyangiaceae bacterium]